MALKVFVNYRRKDAPASAGRLSDALERKFGQRNVFFDTASIIPGHDFVDVIMDNIEACDAMIVVIGPNWLTSDGPQVTSARIHDLDDFVRIEIETAIGKGIPIFPVLVEGAQPLQPDRIPHSIASLSRRQALSIAPDRFPDGARDLIKIIKDSLYAERSKHRRELVKDVFSDIRSALAVILIAILSLAEVQSSVTGLSLAGIPIFLSLIMSIVLNLLFLFSIWKMVEAGWNGKSLLRLLALSFSVICATVSAGFGYVSFFQNIYTPEMLRSRFGSAASEPIFVLAVRALNNGDHLAYITFSISLILPLLIVMAGSLLVRASPRDWRWRTKRQFALDENSDTSATRGLKTLGQFIIRDRAGKRSINEEYILRDPDLARAFQWIEAHGFASHEPHTKSTARIDERGARLVIDELNLIARYRSPIRRLFRSLWY
jgi:hypothetical protein